MNLLLLLLACSDERAVTSTRDISAPDRVRDLRPIDVDSTSVTLTWTAPGDDEAESANSYDIRFDTVPLSDSTWSTARIVESPPIPRTSGQPETLAISSLEKGVTYSFGLRAADAIPNWSALSNIVTVTTDTIRDAIAPSRVLDLEAVPIDSASVQIRWTAPGDDGLIGRASRYEIGYATAPIMEEDWGRVSKVDAPPPPSPAGEREVYVVRGLRPETSYFFAIRAFDQFQNRSRLSNVARASTPIEDRIAPSPVTDLEPRFDGPWSVTLYWTATGDDGNLGRATSYDLRYATSPIEEANWNSAEIAEDLPRPATAGTVQGVQVRALQSETTYWFAIKAMDEAGNWSSLSNVPSWTTSDFVHPGSIQDLSVAPRDACGFELIWTATGDDGIEGRAHSYDLRCSTVPVTEARWSDALTLPHPPSPAEPEMSESYTIGDLLQETSYYFAVRAVDEAGNLGPISNVVPGSTAPAHGGNENWWDGLDSQGSDRIIWDLETYRGDLYATGSFPNGIGPIGRLHGTEWHSVGTQIDGEVSAMTVFAEKLIACGRFSFGGGLAAWDGEGWTPILLSSPTGFITQMSVYDDRLIVAGNFEFLQGIRVFNIAQYDGISWRSLGGGLGFDAPESGAEVSAFEVYDGDLIAVGDFFVRDDPSIRGCAKWDGSTWQRFGDDKADGARTLTTFQGDLIVPCPTGIARWDGVQWSPLGFGVDPPLSVFAMTVYNDRLIVAGGITAAGLAPVVRIVAFDGTCWSPLGSGIYDAPDTRVFALQVHQGSLYVGGAFQSIAGGRPCSNIARWDD